MRIAIVEDDPSSTALLESYLQRFFSGETTSGELRVETFSNGRALFQNHQPGRYAAVFLDCILEGGDTGLDIARQLRERGDTSPLVFVTCSPDFAIAGYEVGAVGYLVKPLSFARLSATLKRIGLDTARDAQRVTLGHGTDAYTVDPSLVTHVEASGHYAVIHTTADGAHRVRASFAHLASTLSGIGSFYSCARGRLVNLDYADRIDRFDFVLFDGARIPISQRNLAAAKRAYADHLFAQLRKDG